jgi:phosphoribosylformimino-5-aminoimidazole carboxamide ribotide isomerase
MMMQVIPAVDLMGSSAVRLVKGVESERKDYGDPVEAALLWARQGAKIIHVIDLDAALGKGSNQNIVQRIVKRTGVDVQVGGGVHSIDEAVKLLDGDVSRVILGSLAFRNPEAVKRLLSLYGDERIVVSLDHSGGMLKFSGWRAETGVCIGEAFERFMGLGVSRFLVTCIDRDGTLGSPDVATIRNLSNSARIMAAGGVASLDDIKQLREAGAEAAVVGRALYEGRLTLPQAMEVAKS